MPSTLDNLMEQASQALAQRAYLRVEALCGEALAEAKRLGDWAYYARIVLPLQEARRQRRMIAADGRVRLGTSGLDGGHPAWLREAEAGCILVTEPHTRHDAVALQDLARQEQRCVEVLLVESPGGAAQWTLRSVAGPVVTCGVAPPPVPWQDRWFSAGDRPEPHTPAPATPMDWFLDAMEALGNAALALVEAPLGDPARVEQIEAMLEAVTDHEILHQRLADAARAVGSR